MINYGKQTIDKKDILEVIRSLKGELLTTGPKVKEFEKKFASFVGSKYAVAVCNGTAALHIACIASGLNKDNELITSPMTFAASANCALYCGAKPVFVDVKENGIIDEELIEKKINKKTKIIIPVHYSGIPCNMDNIKKIARKHNLIVIEDACHALDAKYKNSKIGDCKYSDMACFSFHPVKHITTGEGGMITTNSKILYQKLLKLRSHGITKNPREFKNKSEGPWYHEMQDLGYNYRITDFQSALGISQLKKAKGFVKKRIDIAKRYDKAFEKNFNIEILRYDKNRKNSYHLYIIKLKDKETRLKLFNYLMKKDIFCQVHYIPVYMHPYYKNLGYKKGLCKNAERFYERIISLPIYPELTKKEQNKVIKEIEGFLK